MSSIVSLDIVIQVLVDSKVFNHHLYKGRISSHEGQYMLRLGLMIYLMILSLLLPYLGQEIQLLRVSK